MRFLIFVALLAVLFNLAEPSIAGPADSPPWAVERPKHFKGTDLVADFLVIGSGAGGAAFARGVLDGGHSVIVFEAGDNYRELEDVYSPLKTSVMYSTKTNKYGWQLKSEIDPVTGKATYLNTGRLFGGSTSHNGMQYVRGSKAYFDRWASYGGPAWNSTQILSAYQRLEKFTDEQTGAPLPGRGTSGPVSVRRPVFGPATGVGSLANRIASLSAQASGIPITPDYNGVAQPYGSFPRYDVFQTNSRNRTSSDTAFLGSNIIRPDGSGVGGKKIDVFFKTTVVKILFDKKRNAVGVDAVRQGVPIRVWAKKEVVVAANFQSASLLQSSGVGDSATLNSLGVPVVYNNPNVGRHFSNHPLAVLIFVTPAADGDLTPAGDPQALYGGGGFYPAVNADGTFEAVDNNKPRSFQTLWQSAGFPGIGVFLAQFVRPVSTGIVSIQSNDPLQNPSISEGLYSNSADLDQFARFLYHFVQQNLTTLLNTQGIFGTWTTWNSVEDAKTWLIQNPNEGSHFVGSNRMALSAQQGVVDGQGRVYGVNGLRVADTSIIPEITDGNTAALGMLVGMRIAEFAR